MSGTEMQRSDDTQDPMAAQLSELKHAIERARPHWLVALETQLMDAREARAAHARKLNKVINEAHELRTKSEHGGASLTSLEDHMRELQAENIAFEQRVGKARAELQDARQRNQVAVMKALRPHVAAVAEAYTRAVRDMELVEALLNAAEMEMLQNGYGSLCLGYDRISRGNALRRLARIAELLTERAGQAQNG